MIVRWNEIKNNRSRAHTHLIYDWYSNDFAFFSILRVFCASPNHCKIFKNHNNNTQTYGHTYTRKRKMLITFSIAMMTCFVHSPARLVVCSLTSLFPYNFLTDKLTSQYDAKKTNNKNIHLLFWGRFYIKIY